MKASTHKPLTDEMIQDLSRMCDQDFMAKWNTSRQYPIRARKRLEIKSFINQHGTVEHKFEDGKEYKWCQQEHWELVENFGKHSNRWDGLRGWCKSCERKKGMEYYDKNDGAKRARDWFHTEKGKKSKSSTMRKVWAKRRGNYIKFDLEDEEKIYELCNKSCAYCKTPVEFDELEFDHFIPIQLGGMTEPSNMLPSCPSCNRGRGGKFDKHPVDWLVQKFGQHFGELIYKDCLDILSKV
jgi:5-methylcytosine-specific restriction endonuclease McrA